MKIQWILAVVVVGVAAALPTQRHNDPEELMRLFDSKELGRNSAIENLIINALEGIREDMVTGTDSLPVLDPLQVESVQVDDTVLPIPGAYIELGDLVVSKLSTFEMTQVSVQLTSIRRYQAEIGGNIPLIDVDVGKYDLSLDVFGLNIFGKGDAKITITKPWINLNMGLNIRIGFLAMYMNINELRLEFGLDNINFNITGMFGSPLVDDFVNKFLSNLIMEFAEFWMDDISDIISPIIMNVANDILGDINIIGLIP